MYRVFLFLIGHFLFISFLLNLIMLIEMWTESVIGYSVDLYYAYIVDEEDEVIHDFTKVVEP